MSNKNELLTLLKKEEPLFLLNKTKRNETKKKSKIKKQIFSVLKNENSQEIMTMNTPEKLVSTPQKILQSKSTDCNTTPQIGKKKTIRQISPKELEAKYDFYTNMKKKDQSMSLYLKNDYMKKLNQIDSRKRIILLDWIMEVCCLFHF